MRVRERISCMSLSSVASREPFFPLLISHITADRASAADGEGGGSWLLPCRAVPALLMLKLKNVGFPDSCSQCAGHRLMKGPIITFCISVRFSHRLRTAAFIAQPSRVARVGRCSHRRERV